MSITERREFQANEDAGDVSNDVVMSDDDNAGTRMASIIADANANDNASAEASTKERRGRKQKLDWKTGWLVYIFYTRCNISMPRTAKLFGVSPTLVHDIIYAWANLLCVLLVKFFPVPTRNQILRAHPKSVINKFGHANLWQFSPDKLQAAFHSGGGRRCTQGGPALQGQSEFARRHGRWTGRRPAAGRPVGTRAGDRTLA